jgi:hypothetical protein
MANGSNPIAVMISRFCRWVDPAAEGYALVVRLWVIL